MQVIEVENLSFSYDGKEHILKDINLKIKEGDFVGIVGPNGAGKTTLLKILLGFLKQSGGRVKLFGKDIKAFKEWNRVGYVPQRLSVEQNFPATVEELLKVKGKKERVYEIAGYLHIDNYMDMQFTKLSGGQQQLVLLGMALSSDPELLLLDEPTAGLDLHAQMHIVQILRELSADEGRTVLMVSHDIGLVLKNVDKVLCINRELLFFGEPEEAFPIIEDMFGINRRVPDGTS